MLSNGKSRVIGRGTGLLLGAVLLASLQVIGCSSPKASLELQCEGPSDCPDGYFCWNGACFAEVEDTGLEVADLVEMKEIFGPKETVTLDIPEVEGEQGWPCLTQEDCAPEYICLPLSAKKSICVGKCIQDCPEGYSCRGLESGDGSVQFRCLPEGGRLCEPCSTDVSCLGAENLCMDLEGVLVCGIACPEAGCPEGYACKDVTSIEGKLGEQCVPASGTCSCTPENSGLVRPCFNQSDFGTCFGEEVCQEDGTITACDATVPVGEICDGEDNDCDGQVDEEIEPVACSVTNEFGVCAGVTLCVTGIGEVCSAPEARVELCDFVDNDCDGLVDEDFKNENGIFGTLDHCGGCGKSCVGLFANAAEVGCSLEGAEPDCVIVACTPGYILANPKLCIPAFHHLCEVCSTDASCMGPKDLCLKVGETDTQRFCGRDCSEGNAYGTPCPEGYECMVVDRDGEQWEQCLPSWGSCDCSAISEGQKKACGVENEFGVCFGFAECEPGVGWVGCTAATPEGETCDGKDNNCNGIVDELPEEPCEVTNEWGTCQGFRYCAFGAGEVCNAAEPGPEVCDGVDNDCDGLIDEEFGVNVFGEGGSFVGVSYSLSTDHCGGCGIVCPVISPVAEVACTADGLAGVCTVKSCASGFYPVEGRYCLPVPQATLCLPCEDDLGCPGPEDRCVEYGEDMRCARDCDIGSIYSDTDELGSSFCSGEVGVQSCCPAGYLCQPVGESKQCLRINGTCDCNNGVKEIPCSSNNEIGMCSGVVRCDPILGWLPCSAPLASQEVCNGLDDDCDGLVDTADDSIVVDGLEGYPACENVSGACAGQWVCRASVEGFAWACSAPEPVDEICDGRDNDCDGVVDNGFVDGSGAYTGIASCGQCGLDCRTLVANLAQGDGGMPAEGSVSCEEIGGILRCVPKSCAPGYYPFPTVGVPVTCLKAESSNCLPCNSDADCLGTGQYCLALAGGVQKHCAQRCDSESPFDCDGSIGSQDCCPGGFVCGEIAGGTPGGGPVCVPSSGSCECSQYTVGLARPCSVTSAGETCFGTEICESTGEGFGWSDCTAVGYVEVCDGKDNNCNGEIDEGFVVGGEYKLDGHCGACGVNCSLKWSQLEQHAFGVCSDSGPGGPTCVVGGCVEGAFVGLGGVCLEDSWCAGDPVSSSCLAQYSRCGRRCKLDSECKGGECQGGYCSSLCNTDADCGDDGECRGGLCGIDFDYVNLDVQEGNGCECAAELTEGGIPVFDEPEVFEGVPVGGELYRDVNCDGIDGDLASALFVSSGAGFGNGSLEAPFGSIGDALAVFDEQIHSHILVSSGVYEERVVLLEGAKVFGGYSPDFFQRDVALYPSVVRLASPVIDEGNVLPGVVYGEGIEEETVFAGFSVFGYDMPSGALYAGKASFAVVLDGCGGGMRFVNNRVTGGRGGSGVSGVNGVVGQIGASGSDGHDSQECTNTNCGGGQSLAGGAGGSGAVCGGSTAGCKGMNSDGGESTQTEQGSGYCTFPLDSGGGSNTYSGGPAALCKYDCQVASSREQGAIGAAGTGGAAGARGLGCEAGFGQLIGLEWAGAIGSGGVGGSAGQGGKGGGAGARVINNKSSSCSVGARVGDMGGSGGGGGAGGCGGTGVHLGVPGVRAWGWW